MALDGGFIFALANELKSAIGAHIDKIHQPSKNELVFILRDKNGTRRLLISCASGSARLHFTESRPQNPEVAPMFCMLLRKHFVGGRITDISSENLERVIKITVLSHNSLGDEVTLCVYVELISSAANIIAVGEDGRILDTIHRSSLEKEGRMIQPGAVYEPPTNLNKLDITKTDTEKALNSVLGFSAKPLAEALLSTLAGVSPIICREIAFLSGIDGDKKVSELDLNDKQALKNGLEILRERILNGKPYLTELPPDKKELTFMPLTFSGADKSIEFESFCLALDEFYTAAADKARIIKAAQEIRQTVSSFSARVKKRKFQRQKDLEKCQNSEQLRIFGELLKANLYNITAGQTSALVQNYYDENLTEIKIPLNPALSPANNAAKYFKDYKKSQVAGKLLLELIEEDEREIEYLESVLYNISVAEGLEDIASIKEELSLAGYIRRPQNKKAVKADSGYLKFVSPSGYTVAVGKNNRQNDLLTLKTAQKGDVWFHTKNIPGSHTVIFCGGKELTDEDILFAAMLAAKHSKAAQSSGVPVDYTPIKYVKKPAGAKPGMVVYSQNSTIYVTPLTEV